MTRPRNKSSSSAEAKQKGRPYGSGTRWPGIVNDARTLGVSLSHLRFCLLGKRISNSLLERYWALKAEQGEQTRPWGGDSELRVIRAARRLGVELDYLKGCLLGTLPRDESLMDRYRALQWAELQEAARSSAHSQNIQKTTPAL